MEPRFITSVIPFSGYRLTDAVIASMGPRFLTSVKFQAVKLA
jgi:hypothetical protein